MCLYHVWNSSGCNRLNPHCKSASADICHPANRRGTGVLHAEKAKWQGCTFKECSYDPRSIGRGRCIFKHGTGDEQIAKHDKDKAGISSHQAVVNPPLDPGLAAGQQPQAGGSPGGFWVSEADFEARVERQIAAQVDRQAAREFSNLIEGFNRAGARVRDRLITFLQQWQISHPGLPLTNKCFQALVCTTGNQTGRAATANLVSSFQVRVGQALDSGGTDHILGHRDQDGAYGWVKLPQPLPVDTANGSVSATWRCTVDTIRYNTRAQGV